MNRSEVEEAVEAACARIAPLWPLRNFVAVNPFLGYASMPFHATIAYLRRVARIDAMVPRSYVREAIETGRVVDADIAAALERVGETLAVPATPADAVRALAVERPNARYRGHVPSVAEVLDETSAGDSVASGTAFMIDEISRFCAGYFDLGQSVWRLPGRNLPLYRAWRAYALHDRNPEIMGVRGFRSIVAELPDDPYEAIRAVLQAQGVPKRAAAEYVHAALLTVSGWASYARYRGWEKGLRGERDSTLVELIAVRIAWGYALFRQHTNDAFASAWREAMLEAALPPLDDDAGGDSGLAADLVGQEALEVAYQRELRAKLSGPRSPAAIPAIAAAFCIDVRSEVFRRAFESLADDVSTVGFAGFFGFPIRYIPLGEVQGSAQCPVLLEPQFTVRETLQGSDAAGEAHVLRLRQLRRRISRAWKAFKTSAVSSFVFVEAIGLRYAAKLITDSFALTRPVHDPDTDGLDERDVARRRPKIAAEVLDGVRTGFDDEERLSMAEAVLRAMSMTRGFAPLTLLLGHGSTTVNNPHASGLDCGACGGYTGEANARVAAAILNDPDVRAGLRMRGIHIPDGTWFAGGLHDTTTDDVTLYDLDRAPASHATLVARATTLLAEAGSRARRERAAALRVDAANGVDRAVRARSRDWAQVRPEWGLAGNASFIAAPRERTRGVDLGGRAFLHDYRWEEDRDFSVLRSIMTAPMVVATWINLQYYGSCVNNDAFGSGNKVLHNVTSALGVLEGAGGDLRAGLPWQSVHDGERLVHEPLRLSVVIEAPLDAIAHVVATDETVRKLVTNRWIHLFAMDGDGMTHRYGNGGWERVRENGHPVRVAASA